MQDNDQESEWKEIEQSCQSNDQLTSPDKLKDVLGFVPGKFKENFKKRVLLCEALSKLDKLSKWNFK